MRPRRVLVTDAGRASALAVIRSLGRAGHTVVAADTGPSTVGGASRYCAATATYPSPFTAGVAATARGVAEIADAHAVDVVVPVTDDVLVPLLHPGAALPDGCVLAAAPPDAVEAAASKVATVRRARSLGIPVPDDEVIRDPEAAEGVVDRLGAPVVVKPDRSRVVGVDGRLRKGSVCYAWSDEDVARAADAAGQAVLAQRHHGGTGCGIGLVLLRGRPLVAVQHRRLHEVPVSGGASALRETVDPDPDLLHDACALLGDMGWTGAAMVELKVGPTGAALMEVNGRLWGSLPLALRAGCDVPRVLLEAHLDEGAWAGRGLDTGYERGVRARNLDLELVWIGSVLASRRRAEALVTVPRRDGLAAARDLLRRGQGDDLHAPDDRRPVLAGARRAVAHAARKVVVRG